MIHRQRKPSDSFDYYDNYRCFFGSHWDTFGVLGPSVSILAQDSIWLDLLDLIHMADGEPAEKKIKVEAPVLPSTNEDDAPKDTPPTIKDPVFFSKLAARCGHDHLAAFLKDSARDLCSGRGLG